MLFPLERRHYLGGLLPFVPVLVGIGLKFALIDRLRDGTEVGDHFFETYLRPAWIEFLVTAYVLGFAGLISSTMRTAADLWLLLALPAVCFVLCLLLTLGTAKAGVASDLLQVYLPAAIATVSIATTGGRLASSARQD